jgi:hypothetical protein
VAAHAFELEGGDPHRFEMTAPPAFASDEMAADLIELYWRTLTRDVPFDSYADHPLTTAAVRDLSRCAAFRGPRVGNAVTPGTLFRGPTPGDLTGPYLSQFLWLDLPHGNMRLVQRGRAPVAGEEWLAIQRGALAPRITVIDPVRRHIRNSRDLTAYLHLDQSHQTFLDACAILLVMGAPFKPDYQHVPRRSRTQSGCVIFGVPHVLDCVARVAYAARKATGCQKWLVHPTHPSHPAGRAAIAGACTTVLKAFFDETFVIPDPVVASADGTSLVPWDGAPLTVGGELNKLASNIALGRDAAGVPYRSDGIESLTLGEAVATGILQELRRTCTEAFSGFAFTRFDGDTTRA